MTDRTAILDRLRSDTEASRTAALAAAGNLSTFVQRICKGESLRDAEKSMRYPVGCGKLLLNVGLDRVAAFYRRTDMTELKITQADYDAAARFYGYREYGIVPASGPIVTAAEHFARHRIAAEAVAEQRGYQQGMEEAAGALEADAQLCDCHAYSESECACGAWCEWKTITSARAVEIARAALKETGNAD